MRTVMSWRPGAALATLALTAAVGCGGAQKATKATLQETELELAYDDGQPAERPMLAGADFEWLIKFEPNLPAYSPRRLRLLVAQPGELRLVVYRHDEASGRPAARLGAIERSYDATFTSGGRDGKWISEPLSGIPVQSGPVWVGISVPKPDGSAARLWASKNESPQVYQRDAEPTTALQSGRLPVTPMVRLLIVPESPPPSAPSSAQPPSAQPPSAQPPSAQPPSAQPSPQSPSAQPSAQSPSAPASAPPSSTSPLAAPQSPTASEPKK